MKRPQLRTLQALEKHGTPWKIMPCTSRLPEILGTLVIVKTALQVKSEHRTNKSRIGLWWIMSLRLSRSSDLKQTVSPKSNQINLHLEVFLPDTQVHIGESVSTNITLLGEDLFGFRQGVAQILCFTPPDSYIQQNRLGKFLCKTPWVVSSSSGCWKINCIAGELPKTTLLHGTVISFLALGKTAPAKLVMTYNGCSKKITLVHPANYKNKVIGFSHYLHSKKNEISNSQIGSSAVPTFGDAGENGVGSRAYKHHCWCWGRSRHWRLPFLLRGRRGKDRVPWHVLQRWSALSRVSGACCIWCLRWS